MKKLNVLVEGKRDEKALKKLGFKKVFVLNRSKGFFDLSDKLREKEVLILTDFDPEGEKIASRITKILVKMNSKVRKNMRRKLKKLFITNKINTIEGLRNLFSKKYNGE